MSVGFCLRGKYQQHTAIFAERQNRKGKIGVCLSSKPLDTEHLTVMRPWTSRLLSVKLDTRLSWASRALSLSVYISTADQTQQRHVDQILFPILSKNFFRKCCKNFLRLPKKKKKKGNRPECFVFLWQMNWCERVPIHLHNQSNIFIGAS